MKKKASFETLKQDVTRLGITQKTLADACGVSRSSISLFLTQGISPKESPDLKHRITRFLNDFVATQKQSGKLCPTQPAAHTFFSPTKGEVDMLLQKVTLSQAARKHFKLPANPFINDIACPEDVFISNEIRYATEALWLVTRTGGMLALVGESGAGKTTVLAHYKNRLQNEGRNVTLIAPSVLYMEENDGKGKTLKSAQIIEAIISTIAPSEKLKRTAEAKDRQLRQLLTSGVRAGQKFVLVIEEAHCLPKTTLKHLKRFAEIADGLQPLLSIILIGQTELAQRLTVHDAEVREVAQRIDLLTLPPLDSDLKAYLAFKFKRLGVELDKVISDEGIDALRTKLTFGQRTATSTRTMGVRTISLCYPLAVANALTAALNYAAELGAPCVDAAIVRES